MRLSISYLGVFYFLLALIPVFIVIGVIAQYGIDLPFEDGWSLAPLIEKSINGSLAFKDLWSQNGENRPFFPRLALLSLARLTGWNTIIELYFSAFLLFVVFLILAYQAFRLFMSTGSHWALTGIPLLSLITFSLSQREILLWGYKIESVLCLLSVLLGFSFLLFSPFRRFNLWLSLFFGLIATYSFSSGLLFWFIGFFLLISGRNIGEKDKITAIPLWILFSFIVFHSYFHEYVDYSGISSSAAVGWLIRHPLSFFSFSFKYLGSAISLNYPFTFGLGGLLLYCAIICRSFSAMHTPPSRFFLGIGGYSLGITFLAAFGRCGYGPEWYSCTRYIIFSNLFWDSLVIFLLLQLIYNPRQRIVILILLIVFAYAVIARSVAALPEYRMHHDLLASDRAALIAGPEVQRKYFTSGNNALLFSALKILKAHRLSLYRSP